MAVVTTFVWARRDLSARQRWVAVGLGLAWLLAAALLYHWRGDVPAAEGPDKAIASPDDWLKIAFLSFMTMAALLTPVLVLLWHRGMWSGQRRWLLVTCAVLVAVPALKVRGHFLLGNYFTRWGSYPETLWGPQPEVFPRLVWFLLLLIILGASVAGLAWLLDVTYEGVARRRAQRAEREESRTSTVPAAVVLSVVFGGATFIMAVVTGVLATGVIFDRYLIAAVPFLAAAFVWVLHQQEPGRALGRWATLSLAAWSIIGLHQVDVSATFDAAKWRMGETLVEAGYEPDTIDAGLEWFGLHQPGQVHKPAGVQPAGYPFWLTLFDSPRLCVVTAYDTEPSNLAGVDVVARSSASSLLGTELTLVAHRVDLRC